jgi:hypothetical protein
MPNYPVVKFLVRFGNYFAGGAALLPMIAGLYFAASGAGLAVALAAVVAGALLYVLLKSYVELVTIIADMMLPK